MSEEIVAAVAGLAWLLLLLVQTAFTGNFFLLRSLADGSSTAIDVDSDRDPGPNIRDISLLVPIRGQAPTLVECLLSFSRLNLDHLEILVCIGDTDDPAVPVVRQLIASGHLPARLLIGRDGGHNSDKLNVVATGYAAARYDRILMTDDNVLWTQSLLDDLAMRLEGRVGLVSGAIVAVDENTFAGMLDSVMINGYFTKFQLGANRLGLPFALGKLLLFRRSDLERAGGIHGVGDGLCEDAALAERIRSLGLKVAIATKGALHPVPERSFRYFWHRHLRWSACRRAHAPLFFWIEPVIGLPAAIAWSAIFAAVEMSAWVWAPPLFTLAFWVGIEAVAMRYRVGELPLMAVPAMVLREALLPCLWAASLILPRVIWRGEVFSTRG